MTTQNDPGTHLLEPEDVLRMMEDGSAVLIDVREESEFAQEHIPGAHLVPGSMFDPDAVCAIAGERAVIFQCLSGKRADQARQYFIGATGRDALCLAGSLNRWKAAGLPTEAG